MAPPVRESRRSFCLHSSSPLRPGSSASRLSAPKCNYMPTISTLSPTYCIRDDARLVPRSVMTDRLQVLSSLETLTWKRIETSESTPAHTSFELSLFRTSFTPIMCECIACHPNSNPIDCFGRDFFFFFPRGESQLEVEVNLRGLSDARLSWPVIRSMWNVIDAGWKHLL